MPGLYARQVELASNGKLGEDFELVDYADGNGVQIKPLSGGFTIPTQAEINAKAAEAQQKDDEVKNSKASIKARPSGSSPAQLDQRLTAIEAVLADLL